MRRNFTNTLFIFFFFIAVLPAQIHINEWMSSNSSTITDPDFSDTSDWIELYNNNPDSVDISDYFLSDNLGTPAKWQFPQNTKIPPNSFLLLWADGQDIGLHTNFKLTKAGESIVLSNSDTLRLDSIVYGAQQTDVSMGRQTDGSNDLGFFVTPTPGSSNNTPAFEGITFYEPHFSTKGGFFEAPLEVSLSSIGGTIRYTLDGALPTATSPEYIAPIPISETTNLRARIFQNNYIGGKAVTHSYFLNENFEERALPVISISTNPEYFWDADIGLYVQNFKPEWEYPINIELFENDGSDRAAFNELAGTKVNGQNSWELPQKMLGIYFDNEYDKNNLDYPLFFDRDRSQYDNFTLRASGSDWSSTLFRDGLCQALTTENMDLERMGFRPAITYVNGEYLGIHNMRSRIDEGFIEDNFGYGNNEYDLIENNGEVEEGDAVAFNELFALFETDLTNPSNFQAVDEVMDIPNFTDFFITEIWASNSSWGHNIQLWKPKAAGTKWRWVLVDFDRGFSSSDNDLIDYFTTDNSPQSYNWARTPLQSMLENQSYAQQFASRFADHLYTTFHPKRVEEMVLQHKATIEKEMPYHVNRWAGTTSNYGDGIESVEFWENEVAALNTFAQERQGVMLEDLKSEFGLEDAVNLGTMVLPAEAGHIEINDILIPGTPWNGAYFKNLAFNLEAVAHPGHVLQGWSAATFEALIQKSSDWKYLDNGTDQGTAWQTLDFDDNAWNSGPAQLGYGDGDENTVIDFGADDNDKYPTTYFRKTFSVENPADYTGQLMVNLLRDDGAIVYLNGQELLRSNMPTGPITYDSYATTFVGGAAEETFLSFSIDASLVEGENVLAVELHQSDSNSSDISFDLELKAIKTGQTDFFSTTAQLPVLLSADTFFVAHFQPTGDCLLPAEISEHTTLTIDCSPYIAPNDVTILENIRLTVEAGVEIHFAENANLFVQGNLQVEGTEAAPVHFKALPGTNQWGAISFKFSADTSRLNWLEITDASKGKHPVYENAAISGFKAHLELNQVKIENVFANPISTRYTDIVVKNSQLHSDITGDLINVKYGKGHVENCDFRGNEQVDTDAIDFDEVTNGIIRNNKIYDFFGFNSDGIDIGEASIDLLIENNFIHNCADKGISIGQASSVFAKNNTLVNCGQGISVKDLSTAEIDQNTFYNVATPITCFEKNVGIGGGMAFVSNSILSNSPDAPFLADDVSTIHFSNTLSDTEPLLGTDNLLGNPHFENPTQNLFSLKSNSLAIGAGLDDLGSTIDLGTKSHIFNAPASVIISAIHYHPLDEESEFLQLYNPSAEAIDLTAYAFTSGIGFVFPAAQIAPNETIWLVKDASLFPDVTEQLFTWTSGKLSNSGETLRLSDSYGIIIDQVTYDDAAPWPSEADGEGDWLSLISPDLDNHFAESWQIANPVDVHSPIANIDFQLFPNPATDFVHLQANDTLIEQVEIFNLLGQRLYQSDFVGASAVQIPLKGLVAGVCLLKVNGQVVVEKLVVVE